MRKILVAASIVSVMTASTALALTLNGTNVPGAGVVASKHNMNHYQETTQDSQGRVCAFCHTPHHSISDTTGGHADYLPLWSHILPANAGAYVPYDSRTVGVTITEPLQGATILCMSCHDGVIAIDQHYNTNNTSPNALTSDAFGGTGIGLANNANAPGAGNLANDHPVGFSYDEALAAHPGDLRQKTDGWIGADGARVAKKIGDGLYNGDIFTCASCHDVHNKDNVANAAAPGANYFLYATQQDSQFCVSCHIK